MPSPQHHLPNNPDLSVDGFLKHIPFWGGKIQYNGKNEISLTNTCNIDYYLFSLWVLSKIDANFLSNILIFEETPLLLTIINNIDILNWNMAKQIWVNKIMKYNQSVIRNTISIFGNERDRLVYFLRRFQTHQLIQTCSENCIFNEHVFSDNSFCIFFDKTNNLVHFYNTYSGKCPQCKLPISCEIRFINNSNFIFIEVVRPNIIYSDLPKEITLSKKKYRLICATVYTNRHFVGIFNINNSSFVVDDIGQKCTYLPPLEQNQYQGRRCHGVNAYHQFKITTSLYYLI